MFIAVNPSNYEDSIVVGSFERIVDLVKQTGCEAEVGHWDENKQKLVTWNITDCIHRRIEQNDFYIMTHPSLFEHEGYIVSEPWDV